ncbi:hypothetical protein [Oscillospiraceae bacterium]|nr:hypothetical protein [Oscillospiraceae bacterium]
MRPSGRFVGADGSVRPQKNPIFTEERGEFETSSGRTGSSVPTGFLKFFGSA